MPLYPNAPEKQPKVDATLAWRSGICDVRLSASRSFPYTPLELTASSVHAFDPGGKPIRILHERGQTVVGLRRSRRKLGVSVSAKFRQKSAGQFEHPLADEIIARHRKPPFNENEYCGFASILGLKLKPDTSASFCHRNQP